MHTRINFKKIGIWLLQFLQVQLFLTLFSLPILVHWGLPISVMTVIGNLIFAPGIFVFLFCASLIFFTELFHIPNSLLVGMLEIITYWWKTIVSYGTSSWLIGFKKPSLIILVLMPLTACVCMRLKIIKTLYARVIALSLALLIFIVYMMILAYTNQGYWHVPCGKGHVTIIRTHNSTTVVDSGDLKYLKSPASWIEYSLVPWLNKTCGSCKIHNYICLHPSIRSINAITLCAQSTTIDHVYLPHWHGQQKGLARSYVEMKKVLSMNGTLLARISSDELHEGCIDIFPQINVIKTRGIHYPVVKIRAQVNEDEVEICSDPKIKSQKPSNN